MVELIPSQDSVMQILKKTGAFREGHFVYPNGKHSPHYFQMPLAFRYYDTARVLAVALSRKFRVERQRHQFEVIPLPHPSGASPWHKIAPGKELLRRALKLIARHSVVAAKAAGKS